MAEVLALTVPYRGHLVTAERNWLPVFERAARRSGTQLHLVDGSEAPDEVSAGLEYVSFKENLACALRVCELAGVPRQVALAGMAAAAGDPGSMTDARSPSAARTTCLHAFAANDRIPHSPHGRYSPTGREQNQRCQRQ